MNKIKRFRDKHSISREMYLQINDPEMVEEIVKKESVQRMAQMIYEEMETEYLVEDNPFVGTTRILDIVAMPTPIWKKIERFLIENKFNETF